MALRQRQPREEQRDRLCPGDGAFGVAEDDVLEEFDAFAEAFGGAHEGILVLHGEDSVVTT